MIPQRIGISNNGELYQNINPNIASHYLFRQHVMAVNGYYLIRCEQIKADLMKGL